jgi:hypothetical protein
LKLNALSKVKEAAFYDNPREDSACCVVGCCLVVDEYCVLLDTINSLDKLTMPASKAQLWWLKHKNPSFDAEYHST